MWIDELSKSNLQYLSPGNLVLFPRPLRVTREAPSGTFVLDNLRDGRGFHSADILHITTLGEQDERIPRGAARVGGEQRDVLILPAPEASGRTVRERFVRGLDLAFRAAIRNDGNIGELRASPGPFEKRQNRDGLAGI